MILETSNKVVMYELYECNNCIMYECIHIILYEVMFFDMWKYLDSESVFNNLFIEIKHVS